MTLMVPMPYEVQEGDFRAGYVGGRSIGPTDANRPNPIYS